MKRGAIGVFDSGFGGLAVLREFVKKLPQYDYICFGDTARAPYGGHSAEVVYNFTHSAVEFLFRQGCPLIILACGTASSVALRKIQREYLPKHYPERRVLGVVIPSVQSAAESTKNGRVGIIGTEATISSGAFESELKKINPRIKVFQKACPLLAPMVEAGETENALSKMALGKYLRPFAAKHIDTLILGCTHYGLLEKEIKGIVGPGVKIISEGKSAAEKLKYYLAKHPEIERQLARNGKVKFLTTDITEKFKKLGSRFFGQPIKPQKVVL